MTSGIDVSPSRNVSTTAFFSLSLSKNRHQNSFVLLEYATSTCTNRPPPGRRNDGVLTSITRTCFSTVVDWESAASESNAAFRRSSKRRATSFQRTRALAMVASWCGAPVRFAVSCSRHSVDLRTCRARTSATVIGAARDIADRDLWVERCEIGIGSAAERWLGHHGREEVETWRPAPMGPIGDRE